jgi:hypothetical protein
MRTSLSSSTGNAVKPWDANRLAALFTVVSDRTVTTGLLMMSRAASRTYLLRRTTPTPSAERASALRSLAIAGRDLRPHRGRQSAG